MAIAFDAGSSSAGGTGDFNWSHSGAASGVKGALVLIVQNAGITDEVVGVTYGGTAMGEVAGSPLIHSTGTEDGVLYGYFLGASVPQGTQSVAVDVNATASEKRAAVITVTAAADTEVEDTSTLDSGSATDPSVALTTAVTTIIAGALHSGQQTAGGITPAAGLEGIGGTSEFDFGNQVCGFVADASTVAAGSPTIGWTATAEEAGILAVALKEAAAAPAEQLPILVMAPPIPH